MSNKSKKYLFVFDLDDTLLDDDKKIKFFDRFYLRHLLKKGHQIMFASGRPVRAMMRYYKMLKLNTPLICHNGSLIYHPLEKDYPNLFYPFLLEDIDYILKNIKLHGNESYHNAICETLDDVFMIKKIEYEDKFLHFENVNMHYGEFEDILHENPQSFIVDMGKENYDMKFITSIISKKKNMDVRFWGRPMKSFFEVFYKGLSKASAIEYVLEKTPSLKNYTLVSFGDSDNDYPMLDYAKENGFIMKNSHHLKETNYKISLDDNNHSGVVKTIKKLLRNS